MSSSSRPSKMPGPPDMAAGPSAQGAAEDVEDVVDAMGRKVWDKDFYMEKAKSNIMFGPEKTGGRRKDNVIPLPSSQRTYLKQRNIELNLEKDLGKSKVVTQHTIKPSQGGYWCSCCECLIKDSSAYLEHVNGRRHNRNLGMNMKVEKIGVDRVREKLKAMRKGPEVAAIDTDDIVARIQAAEEEQEEKKRRKKLQKKKKQKRAGGAPNSDDEPPAKKSCGENGEEEASEEEAEEDDEETKMLKQMGLPTGFG